MCQKWDTSFGFDGFLTEFTWISQLDEIKIDFLILGRYNKNIEVLATEK